LKILTVCSMNSDVKRWIEKQGVLFLRELGLKDGNSVLDFGCGAGHYAIPASFAVRKKGRVYALDKNADVLKTLKQIAGQYSIKNIELINEKSMIPLKDNTIDFVLCYDIIHYEEKIQRKAIYREVYRVLKKHGFFSVYPKHHKDDYPLNKLASVELDDIIKEIEESGFVLESKLLKNLLHDVYVNLGYVLNFRRS
jgi:ubiquinone/menaquinone biosynthesis C-methylase UbiE